MNRRGLLAALLLVLPASSALAQAGVGLKRRPPPAEYGRVVFTPPKGAKLPPVAFDHWLHRTKFSCRLCHVELGFAWTSGASGSSRTS